MGRLGVRAIQIRGRDPGSFGWEQVCLAGWLEPVAWAFLAVGDFCVPSGQSWGRDLLAWGRVTVLDGQSRAWDHARFSLWGTMFPSWPKMGSGLWAMLVGAGVPVPASRSSVGTPQPPERVWDCCASSPELGAWVLHVWGVVSRPVRQSRNFGPSQQILGSGLAQQHARAGGKTPVPFGRSP